MKKASKIIAIIAAVILVIVIGLTLFVKTYLTDARIRAIVTSSVESSLNRKVSLGDISVSIFRGISVDDFEIREKDSETAFVKADSFVLKYQLLPLISRTLVIDELVIESPRVAISKNVDGSFNFSDLARREEGDASVNKKEIGDEPSGLPVSLSVQSLRIGNGRIEYSDPGGAVKKALIGLNADMVIQGESKEVINASGKTDVIFHEVVMKERPNRLTEIRVSAQYRTQLNLAEKRLSIGETSVSVLGIPVMLGGTVNYGEPFSYTVDVNAASVDMARVQNAATAFLPEGIGLGGVLSLKIVAEQKPDKETKPVFRGEVNLNNVAVQMREMRPVFRGTVTLSPEEIGFKAMKLVAGESSADIRGRIIHYSKNPDIRIDMTSSMLDLDAVMASSGKGGAGSTSESVKRQEKEFEPLRTGIRAGGSVDIARMLFKGVTIRNIKARYEFRDNIFTLASLNGSTLSGNFMARSTVDLSKRGAVYTLHAETDGVKLEEITAAFVPKAKENLFGSLSARADISGAGSVSDAIKRNLKGKGSFSVKDGKIKNAPVSDGLLMLLGLQSLKEIPMEKAEGSFTIAGGVMDLKSVIVSKDLMMDETGTIGVIDQKLDMGILVKVSDRLAPTLVSRSAISKFLSEEKGWTTVPLKLSGTIAEPSYGVDTRAIGKKATETIQRRLGEEVFKALSGDREKQKSPEKTQQEQQPAETQKKKSVSPEDLLKELLK